MHISTALLALTAALLPAIHPDLVGAQIPSRPVAATAADTVTSRLFEIPRQPLAQAIVAFQARTGIEIVFDGIDLGQIQSSTVSGSFTSAQALRRLLSETGFAAHFLDESTVSLSPAVPPVAHTLRAVEVVASRAGYAAAATSTATRTPTPLRDIPQSISIITRALIQDLSMQSMADAVRFVPGVTMGQGEGNRDQPTIRGNNTTADFFVDGVRDDVQYFRDLYNVERIEALKGSNAMVFGRGGGGGVLNRVTKQAEWSASRELT